MNKSNLYRKLITYCQETTPRERILNRNPDDERLNGDIYAELHHIIPKHHGGSDEDKNLVLLLPEEHLLAHHLLWKIYKKSGDIFSIRVMINGYRNKPYLKGKLKITKKVMKYYSIQRESSYRLRVAGGYHTEEAKKSISKSRKGTMPVKDSNTGEMIGSVSTKHPKVISGEWVHHSKGVKYDDERVKAASERYSGKGNIRYSGITDEEILEFSSFVTSTFGVRFGIIPPIKFLRRCWNLVYDRNFPNIQKGSFRFGGLGAQKITDHMLNEYPELKLDKYVKKFGMITDEEIINVIDRRD